jgi:hypothetical protein
MRMRMRMRLRLRLRLAVYEERWVADELDWIGLRASGERAPYG